MIAIEQAQQIRRVGSFELGTGAEQALPFFSPEGERAWVKGWDPTPVFPARIEFRRDTVFRQGPEGDEAVWTIVDVDEANPRAEYVRVAPSHTGHVVVTIAPLGERRCRVTVAYTITVLGEDRSGMMATFSEEAFAARMRSWQQQISSALDQGN